ncbi:polysaccharide deacetylase family protein [Oceanirhabdus seepicola]|uniref:Polysaccharide deacetylase family protein n=1 Tax=Oceanirhabdus seepicola TaxID=2828781 RepID=A0A9J6NW97_9CLOT|nr:polysaccharide deacetylase family protein [Oceanirhabdus seepicola]MCM1988515.1 polysaccharide deacetylase family protein [Oceanirhabdus seepicola]
MLTKKVYLTIDDAPSKDFREKVDYLYERNIPAIFFCIGENIIKYEEDVIYAIRKGFIIGNHSFNHKYFSNMTLVECKDSIKKTDDIIEELYIKSNIDRPMKLFRFPHFDQGGDLNSEAYEGKWSKPKCEWSVYEKNDKRLSIQEFLSELGYIQPKFEGINIKFFSDKTLMEGIDIRCTFDQMEYFLDVKDAPYGMYKEESILHRIDEDVPYEGRSLNCYETADIILIHDQEKTTRLFYEIIDRYLEKKFEFLKLTTIEIIGK